MVRWRCGGAGQGLGLRMLEKGSDSPCKPPLLLLSETGVNKALLLLLLLHSQEIVDRLSLTVRPTVLDLGGETFSGDLPQLMLADAAAAAALSAAGSPATGGTLLLSR